MSGQEPSEQYEGALGESFLASPETIESLLATNPKMFKSTVQHLLTTTEGIEAQKLFSLETRGF